MYSASLAFRTSTQFATRDYMRVSSGVISLLQQPEHSMACALRSIVSDQSHPMKSIPKIIHYCWFGKQSKPNYVEDNIAGWKLIMPDYEVMEWNESNFNININQYVTQAYKAKLFAFVSDYARLYAMYHYGGIYLDTDVEVLRPFDDLLGNQIVFGFEVNQFVATSTLLARKNSVLIKDFMNSYDRRNFTNNDSTFDLTTNVKILTDILISTGLVQKNYRQSLDYKDKEQVLILEQKFLSPFDYNTKDFYTDSSTYTVHHFRSSWSSASFRLKMKLKKTVLYLIGYGSLRKVMNLLK